MWCSDSADMNKHGAMTCQSYPARGFRPEALLMRQKQWVRHCRVGPSAKKQEAEVVNKTPSGFARHGTPLWIITEVENHLFVEEHGPPRGHGIHFRDDSRSVLFAVHPDNLTMQSFYSIIYSDSIILLYIVVSLITASAREVLASSPCAFCVHHALGWDLTLLVCELGMFLRGRVFLGPQELSKYHLLVSGF